MDVTPLKFPISMNGNMQDHPALRAHDPLHARSLVLDDGKTRIAIVVVDNCLIPRELMDDAKRQAHELTGLIALEEKDYEKAVAELQQANQQNPYDLYRLCQAYQGKGDKEKAKEFCMKAVGFNSLPQLNYAFIRMQAEKIATGMKA